MEGTYVTKLLTTWRAPPALTLDAFWLKIETAKVVGNKGLLAFQQGVEIGGHIGAGPVLGADDLAIDASVAVDDVRVGIHRRAVGQRDFPGCVAISRKGEIVSLAKIFVGGFIVVDADAEDGAAHRLDTTLQLIERRGFVDAWRAPSGPEIQ